MHHYGKDTIQVTPTETDFEVVILNKETGQAISIQIPRKGVLSDPTKIISLDDANQIAKDIAHLLSETLI